MLNFLDDEASAKHNYLNVIANLIDIIYSTNTNPAQSYGGYFVFINNCAERNATEKVFITWIIEFFISVLIICLLV